jgi:hypothetical protein
MDESYELFEGSGEWRGDATEKRNVVEGQAFHCVTMITT